MAGERMDLIVAGGGVSGLTLAVAVAQALGPAFRIAVHDPSLAARSGPDNIRAYAISAFGWRQFRVLGLWPDLENAAHPITRMIVTDSAAEDPVRPVLLRFEGEIGHGEAFAQMIPEGRLLEVLARAAREAGVTVSPVPIAAAENGTARLADGGTRRAALLVAADGRRSRLRERAGIPFYGWDYRQNAIVVPVAHERDHGGLAEEHFLPGGPFAILPMRAPDGTGTQASIVWTERREAAERLCALEPERFDAALEQKFGLHLGQVRALARPETYPLGLGLARRLYGSRLALLGDAAHLVHPLAGQGLNLGLKDAAVLAGLIVGQARLGLDIGAPELLVRYDAARRFDTAVMAVMTDVLNRLFSNDMPPVRALRDLGLGFVERAPLLKRFLIREAAGTGHGRMSSSAAKISPG